jgi:3'-phosphoadenosine 5'-phosphosulfate sulfotransferase (PAPS reductase)/FAD synthetase
MNFAFTSGGNDSWALIQWMIENGHTGIAVYNDTGWAAPWWPERIEKLKDYCIASNMFEFKETQSMGLIELAKQKMAFPRQGMQFCTEHLKRLPSLELMNELDPDCEGTVFVGVRREESEGRKQWPEHVIESEAHGGRDVWSPLVRHDEAARNELLARAGIEPLPHRSQECYPCVNENRAGLRKLDPNRIDAIEIAEEDMGIGPRSKKRKTFFRPKSKGGAIGIREVIKWANDGKYIPGQADMFGSGCDSGFCGD